MITLSEKYLNAIARNRNFLVDDLMVSDVILQLRESKYFTLDDQETIEHEITSTSKTSKLLDILTEKPDECFEKFMEVLCMVSEHLAESLTATIENRRSRRLSESEFGNILIQGGVPDRCSDYIPRREVENTILTELKKDSKHPILVHGEAGCGKSTIVSHVLHNDGLFDQRYCRVCWMPIGKIEESEVLSKLISLCTKLDSQVPDPNYQIADMYKTIIINKLVKHNILLILDDIWSSKIMTYFTFPVTFVVTSRSKNLFQQTEVTLVEVPPKFSDAECQKFLQKDPIVDKTLLEKTIRLSYRNPMCLSMIKNLLKSNEDYISRISDEDIETKVLNEILKSNLDILSAEMKNCYTMLSIFEEDETVSVNLLSIYWNISETKAIEYLNILYDHHLVNRKWINEYQCNMYGMHDMQRSHLRTAYKGNLKEYEQKFIERHTVVFQDWLKFNYQDPYFFKRCAFLLTSTKDFTTLKQWFTDFTFLASRIVISGISDLLFDYETNCPSGDSSLWDEFKDFFMRHNHKFVHLPQGMLPVKIGKVFISIIQLALFENNQSNIFKIATSLKDRSPRKDFWFWDNAKPSTKIWEACNMEVIELMEVNDIAILLSADTGRLSLYEINTGKCLFNYKIFDSKIILAKFNTPAMLDFYILVSNGQIKRFNVLQILDNEQNVDEQCYDDDDLDFVDEVPTVGVDFNKLRQKFQNLLSSNFITTCAVNLPKDKVTDRTCITGYIGCDILTLVTSSRPQELNHPTPNYYIQLHDLDSLMLKNDFKIDSSVKKIIHTKCNKNDVQVYVLREDGSSIDVYDDWGNKKDRIAIDDEIIYDFIIVEMDIYFSVRNSIYKNKDKHLLFSTPIDEYIQRISMCRDKKLMAICLTNQSLQIWNIEDQRLLDSIKGLNYIDAQFSCCNSLVAIEGSNISKWSIDHLNHGNRQVYRYQFHMERRGTSSTLWIIQKYNNNLEFLTLENGDYSSRDIQSHAKANCFSIQDQYAFVGFSNVPGNDNASLLIYDLNDLTCQLRIDTVVNVHQLVTLSVKDDQAIVVVHYDIDKVKIFLISMSNCSIVHESNVMEWNKILKLKLFKILPNKIFVGVSVKPPDVSTDEFILYSITLDLQWTELIRESFEATGNINDFDVDDIGEHVCVVTASGDLKVWNINQKDWKMNYNCDESSLVLRKCTFRPTIKYTWKVVATVDDNGEVRLFYFFEDKLDITIITEDFKPTGFGIFSTMTWTKDGEYLILGDSEIKKWKVKSELESKLEVKLPLTKFYTHFGGIRCIFVNDKFISTVDRGGFFYILRKL